MPLKNKTAGKKNIVISKRLKEKIPITDSICKLSCDQEKLYAQRFQGNPVSIIFLAKSPRAKSKLIKKIDDIFSFIKYPVQIMGKEKNKDKKSGIKNKPNGIKILNESSKVIE